MNQKIKIGIIEDNVFFRKSICECFNRSNLCEVFFEQSTGAEIFANIDLRKSDVEGIKALNVIKEKRPMRKVKIYSSLFKRAACLKSVGNKIQDFLPKNASSEEVLQTIIRVTDS